MSENGHDENRVEEEEEEEIDEDTFRVMVSTDNHLGYAEKCPIRGNDSFAAFEEVLCLARRRKCDMVLLAGDLFHENKPSRRSLHKAMDIMKRYCFGPNPVSFQIVSNQKENFRSNTNQAVNYEDPFSSVDLPVFSIHGNHDDPTRDGGTEMLAALDIMAVTNLLNYFGRQDEVDKVQVSPILMKKGTSKVCLYGLGSMREERLNRMWSRDKAVRFLRPESDERDEDDDEDEDEVENNGWFNIFALHQNRDFGRGSKNCVHESMIPEWMDLIVWGHEHECKISPSDSSVGTFRISQPGSSVATTLTAGEAVKKHVGILDIRNSQFRLNSTPLTQVRSFAIGHIVLSECEELDPDDAGVDDAITEILAEKVQHLIQEAREESMLLSGRDKDDRSYEYTKTLKYQIYKPEQVLVRLRVEHTSFSTLNNQRFGSRFVNEVANPSDMLLFYRKKTQSSKAGGKDGSAQKGLAIPVLPNQVNDEVIMGDIVKENLGLYDKKLQVLDEDRLGNALEEFVSKEQKQTITDTVDKIVSTKQKTLVRRGISADGESGDDDEHKVTSATAVREVCNADSQKNRDQVLDEENLKPTRPRAKRKKKSAEEDSDDDDVGSQAKSTKSRKTTTTKPTKRARNTKARAQASDDDSDIEIIDVGPGTSKSKSPTRKKRGATSRNKRKKYEDSDDDDENEFEVGDDDSDVEVVEKPAKRGRKTATATAKSSSFTSSRRTRKKTSYREDSDDDSDNAGKSAGWGTATSQRARR